MEASFLPARTTYCRDAIFAPVASFGFSKWQGTGNDFVLVDDRSGEFPLADRALITLLCDRHFGIGSDGLILIQKPRKEGSEYHMEFFNPDGSRSFCGNGSRCAYAFWSSLTGERGPARFTAIDGEHTAEWSGDLVTIGMRSVGGVERIAENVQFLNTGSPHLLLWVDDPSAVDILPEARVWRYGDRFGKEGVNVNFLTLRDGEIVMRTYERGVEAETLSCGTGVTAAALGAMARGSIAGSCAVNTPGGRLEVNAEEDGSGGYRRITLAGPVKHVFNGTWG